MAITGVAVWDSDQLKIVDITSDNVAADQTTALTFAALGMTDFSVAPLQPMVCDTAANGGVLAATHWTVSAWPVTGFTVNRCNAANTSATCRVILKNPHSKFR